MTEDATPVSPKPSRARSDHVLERIEQWAEENPEATEYILTGEDEAAQVLLAIAATIKLTARGIENQRDKALYMAHARRFRQRVVKGEALECFREMTEDDQLELYGKVLVAPRIVLQ
jgi:hypothetical protein